MGRRAACGEWHTLPSTVDALVGDEGVSLSGSCVEDLAGCPRPRRHLEHSLRWGAAGRSGDASAETVDALSVNEGA